MGFKAATLSCSDSDPGKLKFLKQNYPGTSDLTATIDGLTMPWRVGLWGQIVVTLLFALLKARAS